MNLELKNTTLPLEGWALDTDHGEESDLEADDMSDARSNSEETIDSIKNAAGIILGVSENRSRIELFFEGDLMHTQTVDLPAGSTFDIYVEEIPHKSTVYEHPRTMIFFDGPCDLRIARDGNRIIVTGGARSHNHIT